jgi:DNA polymerase-4
MSETVNQDGTRLAAAALDSPAESAVLKETADQETVYQKKGDQELDHQQTVQRKIIHVDMDAFFASVEQRDFPEYRGQPLIVGGNPQHRGVVAACSYEARKFGIHSAMSSAKAHQLCPNAIFVKPRFEAYREASIAIQGIFKQYTALVEPLSLDEAFLDVTGSELCSGSATLIARDIKQKIYQETGLTASAGISYNKFLAKIASDMDKPDGLFVVLPSAAKDLLESLAIRKFHGIGKATEAKMQALGINCGRDLKQWSKSRLQKHFGRMGVYYYGIVRGEDERPVHNNRLRKSIGAETTFSDDLIDTHEMLERLHKLAEKVVSIMQAKKMAAKTITLKVKFDNFEQVTRSHSEVLGFQNLDNLLGRLPQLLEKTDAGERKVRLLGVSVSNLFELNNEAVSPEQIRLI